MANVVDEPSSYNTNGGEVTYLI